jgi:hypothetical protein
MITTSNKVVTSSSSPASDDDGDGVVVSSPASGDEGEAVCYLCLNGGGATKLISHCDVTVLVEGQMLDLSISRALLILQKPKVSRLMI